MIKKIYIIFLFLAVHFHVGAELLLKDNLKKAEPGDFLVTAQNKNYTVLLIRSKDADYLSVEEITVPSSKISNSPSFSWRKWVGQGAPGNSCWLLYYIHLPTGAIQQTYSFSRRELVVVPQSQNFLSTLLNLHLNLIPEKERKKVGPPPPSDSLDRRAFWQPKLISEGKVVPGVTFDGWRTHWPKDGSELSDRTIEIFLPRDSTKYPSYFPYWLQINGMLGKAKVRIVDSGKNLYSPNQDVKKEL